MPERKGRNKGKYENGGANEDEEDIKGRWSGDEGEGGKGNGGERSRRMGRRRKKWKRRGRWKERERQRGGRG